MKRRLPLVALWVLAGWGATASAQDQEKDQDKPPEFGIDFSGFVKTDMFYDSRQTVSVREGHFLLFPQGVRPDPAGTDIHAASSFHMLSIQTRLMGRITAPDTLGAKTSGLVEAEFFGTSDSDVNGFRLRHALVRLNWPRTELLVGQFWHPMFITESFPEVVSFNTGAPFQPFNRSPQVRLTHRLHRFSVAVTALSQRDFTSPGPLGASSVYLRNAVSPELNGRVQYAAGDPAAGTETVAGAALNYLRIRPRLATEAGFKTSETVGGWATMAYFKQRRPGWTFKAEAAFGENLHHLTMLGGYVARRVLDPATREVDYTSLGTFAAWSDVHTNGRTWQPGVFVGYTRNLGAGENFVGPVHARGADIAHVYRVSPRIVFNTGRFRFAGETEWTSAAYGVPDSKGVVRNAENVGNLRVLLATYLFF